MDYAQEKELTDYSKETAEVAGEYYDNRVNYAKSKIILDAKLADAFKAGTVKESMAIEKAYVQLTINDAEAKTAYERMVESEQTYKGLEQVLEARKAYINLHQSLLKNPKATA